MTCDMCDQDKDDVLEINDPFYSDVYDEVVVRCLCDDCYEERRMEI
jgi:hypothetical protein